VYICAMKIVILQGSPRKEGNTARLAGAFAEGASERHEVEIFDIPEMKIGGCLGCNSCKDSGICAQKDEMQRIYFALNNADMLVLASPVYFYGLSSQLKACIDRLHNPIRDKFHIHKAAILLSGGSSKPQIFDAILREWELCLEYFGIEDAGRVLIGGNTPSGEEMARDLGRKI